MKLSYFLPYELSGFGISEDVSITGFNIDSRSIKPGEVFVAIKGERFDGNRFAEDAVAKGASALILSEKISSSVPVIVVDDVVKFLQKMAVHIRAKMNFPVIAITGSVGKTATKGFLASVLKNYKPTLATEGNFNSQLGLPLTMLRMRENYNYGVFEIGTSMSGEIANLADLLRPNIGIITNIGRSHLAGIGGLDGVAKEKSSLFTRLIGDKVAVINCDNKYFDYMRDMAAESTWYGFTLNEKLWLESENKKNIWLARDIKVAESGCSFIAVTSEHNIKVHLNTLGKHNVYNALAAIAVAKHLNVPDDNIIAGLAETSSLQGRSIMHKSSFGRVIDDSYNASPESCKAAITTLSNFEGKKVFVFGDMKELGEDEIACHLEVGGFAKQSGIDYMFCYGDVSRYSAEEFGSGAFSYSLQDQLYDDLIKVLDNNCVVLVKGSFSMKMSNIVKKLIKVEE